MTNLQDLITKLTDAYARLQALCPFADPNDKSWLPAGEQMVAEQEKIVHDALSVLCSYLPNDHLEAKTKADAIMNYHWRDPGNMISDEHLRLLCESYVPAAEPKAAPAPEPVEQASCRISSERIDLLNDLELETFYQRDLMDLIADNLNDVYQDDISERSKGFIRSVSTLAFVARDRLDAAVNRMNATYRIEEKAV